MKKIERESIRFFLIQTIAIVVAGFILYPLLDLIYTKFITNSEFVYSIEKHIIEPLNIGIITGICLYGMDKVIKK